MLLSRINTTAIEDFSVIDSNKALVSGITLTEFTAHLYGPNGLLSAQPVSFVELGNGHYRASYTPNATGTWMLIVYHATYFPSGKADTICVYNEDIDTVALIAQAVKDIEYGRWLLSGGQMIFYKEDNTTEVARFNITTNAESQPIERVKV